MGSDSESSSKADDYSEDSFEMVDSGPQTMVRLEKLQAAGYHFPEWLRIHILRVRCHYCAREFGSLQELDHHLNTTVDHPVFACCGVIFKNERALKEHRGTCGRDSHQRLAMGKVGK